MAIINFTDILLATVLTVGVLSGLLSAQALNISFFRRKRVIAYLGLCVVFSLGMLFLIQIITNEMVLQIPENLFVVFAGCFCFLTTYLFALGFLIFLRDHRRIKI